MGCDSYVDRPDYYCDLCGSGIRRTDNYTATEDDRGNPEFYVHDRCIGKAIALAVAVKGVVKERI